MIEARNLHKIYKPKKGVPVSALNDVSLKLPDKGMVFILGKSGSGKSTLLNVLGGLDMVDSGEIIIKGVSAKDFKQPHYDSYRNTYVGFIFQEYNILEEFTVGANVALAIELQGRKPTDDEINKILKKVDLDGYGQRKPNELSGGQKQRVAIARALVKNPEIIMADEPTGALDSATGRQVFDTLKSLSKEKLILIVSHDREFSEQYADRIIELADGKIISDVEKVSEHKEEVVEQNLSYNENEIEIKQGYTLTDDDLKAINRYIATLSTDAKLIIKGEKRPDASGIKYEFRDTDESNITIKKDDNFKLIKSKLSLKNAFKIGSGGLKHKKFRLIFTIFLSFIAFTLFGLADTIASYDNVGTAITSIIDSGVDYASFKKKVTDRYGDFYLSDNDLSLIKNNSDLDVKGVYFDNMESTSFRNHLSAKSEKLEFELATLFTNQFSGFAEINATDLQHYGYTLTGKLPDGSKNEIAVSKYIYQAFEKVGFTYLDSENNTQTAEIKSYDDLIGMSIEIGTYGKYIITGIIDTGFDYTRYEALLNQVDDPADMIVQMALSSELSAAQQYSMNCVAFVGDGAIARLKSASDNIGKEFWNYGNIHVTTQPVKDNDSTVGDVVTENTNYFYYYPSRLARLEEVPFDIIWLNGEKAALAADEYVVTPSFVRSLLADNDNIKWYEPDALKGYEKTLYDKSQNGELPFYVSNLYDFVNGGGYRTAAAYKYVTADSNKAAARKHLVDSSMLDKNSADKLTDEELVDYYMRCYGSDPAIQPLMKEYLDSLIETYKLSGSIIRGAELDKINVKVTYNGQTFYSLDTDVLSVSSFLDQYEYMLLESYVFANLDKAKEYYLSKNPDAVFDETKLEGGKYIPDFYNVINTYRESLYMGEKNKTLKEEVRDYINGKYFEIIKNRVSSDGIRAEIYVNGSGNSATNYSFKIVGIVGGTNENHYDYLVCSSDVYELIFGENVDGIYSFAVAPMPSSRGDISDVVKFSYEEFGSVHYSLQNSVTFELDMVDELLDVLGQVFLYVGIALAVFASLMLSNFIGTSVSLKKQEIGILRAIGSRSNDVFRIFFAESFIIAMINFVLSLIGTITVTIVINSILRDDIGILITILNFGIRQIGLLLIISVGMAFISTFLPVKKIASKKPIDAIRKR